MKNVLRGALAVAAILLIAASAAGAKPKPKHKPKPKPPAPPAAHIFVIMLENHSKSSVLGDVNAPYINSLTQQYAVAANYFGVTHPSEPNYVAAISGSNWFVNDDNPANRFNHTNIVDQLEAKKLTWGAYMESMPSTGYTGDFYPGTSQQLYASKHNPFVLFDDIRANPARLAHIKPYTSLATDLQRVSTTPNFVWITPNQCHDMHGGVFTAVASDGSDGTPCPFGSTKDDANDAALKQKADDVREGRRRRDHRQPRVEGRTRGDLHPHRRERLHRQHGDRRLGDRRRLLRLADPACRVPVPRIELAPPDGHTWAGGMYGGGLIPAIVVTNKGKTGGFASQAPYNHYSLLATDRAGVRAPVTSPTPPTGSRCSR